MDNNDKFDDMVWNLKILYPDHNSDEIINDANKALQKSIDFQKKYKGIIKNKTNINPELIYKILSEIENISELIAKPGGFAYLLYAQDTSDSKSVQLMNKIEEISTEISNNMLFFTIEFNTLTKTERQNLIKNKKLKKYRHYLQKISDEKKFQLNENEEKIVNLKNITGLNAFRKLYSNIKSKFLFKIKIDGKEKIFNETQLVKLRYDSNWNMRRKSSQTQFYKYKDYGDIFSEIYNNIIKDISLENEMRGFANNIAAENFSNELSDVAISNLIEVTNHNSDIVRNFYKLKAILLKKDKIRLCDTRVEFTKRKQKYSWKDAKEIILEAFSDFNNQFYKIAKDFFEQKRIHAKIQDNKLNTDFCLYSSPDIPPFILTNFSGTQNDIISLAHELGHGIHATLFSKQNLLNYSSNVPFAETASIFCELLVTEKLLNLITDNREKISLIASKIEDIISTSFRQNMFTNFELKAHQKIKYDYMDKNFLSELYLNEIRNLFGDSVIILDEYRYEWMSIPHLFLTPFYCYGYNFAQLFVLSIYEKYLSDGKIFKDLYIQFLESGGKDSPEKLAKIISIDINDPKIWQSAFDLINQKFLKELMDNMRNL